MRSKSSPRMEKIRERLNETAFGYTSSGSWIGRRFRLLERIERVIRVRTPDTIYRMRIAAGLADAFAARDRKRPFDLVHCANTSVSGLFVPPRPGCPLVLRLSSARDLWFQTDEEFGRGQRFDRWLYCYLERAFIRKAALAYAPNEFLADHFQERHALKVEVIRPPAYLEVGPGAPPPDLPRRYMVHFGQLRHRKGTDVLAEALPWVWDQLPDFRMVWAGREAATGMLDRFRQQWGEAADRVIWVGSLSKPALYAVVRMAEAAVLPSVVDNLPNTVIESLLLGTPVIGSRGASIDELVEDGVSGRLIPIGDPAALAEAIVASWKNPLPRQFAHSAALKEGAPDVAIANLVAAFGRAAGRAA